VRRGATLVELLVTTALLAAVLGSITTLYAFTAGRTAHGLTYVSAAQQADLAADAIARTVQAAVSCSSMTVASRPVLKCEMPATATDLNHDGYPDEGQPLYISRRGQARFGKGNRVWYFAADSTGNIAAPGTYLWRAQGIDDNLPSTAAVDLPWTGAVGSGDARLGLIRDFGFAVDTTGRTVTINITASAITRGQTRGDLASRSDTYQVMRVRTVHWRNGRP
jgi:hypothetical protein